MPVMPVTGGGPQSGGGAPMPRPGVQPQPNVPNLGAAFNQGSPPNYQMPSGGGNAGDAIGGALAGIGQNFREDRRDQRERQDRWDLMREDSRLSSIGPSTQTDLALLQTRLASDLDLITKNEENLKLDLTSIKEAYASGKMVDPAIEATYHQNAAAVAESRQAAFDDYQRRAHSVNHAYRRAMGQSVPDDAEIESSDSPMSFKGVPPEQRPVGPGGKPYADAGAISRAGIGIAIGNVALELARASGSDQRAAAKHYQMQVAVADRVNKTVLGVESLTNQILGNTSVDAGMTGSGVFVEGLVDMFVQSPMADPEAILLRALQDRSPVAAHIFEAYLTEEAASKSAIVQPQDQRQSPTAMGPPAPKPQDNGAFDPRIVVLGQVFAAYNRELSTRLSQWETTGKPEFTAGSGFRRGGAKAAAVPDTVMAKLKHISATLNYHTQMFAGHDSNNAFQWAKQYASEGGPYDTMVQSVESYRQANEGQYPPAQNQVLWGLQADLMRADSDLMETALLLEGVTELPTFRPKYVNPQPGPTYAPAAPYGPEPAPPSQVPQLTPEQKRQNMRYPR